MCNVLFIDNAIEGKKDLKDKMTKETLIITIYFEYRTITELLGRMIYIEIKINMKLFNMS